MLLSREEMSVRHPQIHCNGAKVSLIPELEDEDTLRVIGLLFMSRVFVVQVLVLFSIAVLNDGKVSSLIG